MYNVFRENLTKSFTLSGILVLNEADFVIY